MRHGVIQTYLLAGECSRREAPSRRSVLAAWVTPRDSLKSQAFAGAGDRRTELYHRMTAPNTDVIDAEVAPERHLGRWAQPGAGLTDIDAQGWNP